MQKKTPVTPDATGVFLSLSCPLNGVRGSQSSSYGSSLLYGQEIWETEHLKVPHPYMSQRAFVLVPLIEIADDLVDPKTGQAYKKYLSQLNTSDVRKLEVMD